MGHRSTKSAAFWFFEVPMSEDHKLHVIEPIVTGDKYEYGLHRLSVPGGWIYWLSLGGAPLGTFVPLPLELAHGVSAELLNSAQEEMVAKIAAPEPETYGAS